MQYTHFLNNKQYLFLSALTLLFFYMLPAFLPIPIFVENFDNLDSTVVWYKILAQSGKIFSSSSSIVPNMMNGLPRISYGSEFSILFWLYYFFDAETAFRINFILIHTTAFFSMYLLLSRYFTYQIRYRNLIVTFSSLLFAILPFWPGAGLTTSVLPLICYIFLNIRNNREKPYEWFLLLLIPFYTSLIFLYIFVLFFLWVIFAIDTFIVRKLFNKKLFMALFIFSAMYILIDYRLFLSLLHPIFISHRTEFDVYFTYTFRKAHIYALKFFLDGWMEHQRSLMMPWLLPLVIIATILSSLKKKFDQRESMLIWLIILLSFLIDVWQYIMTNKYTLLWVSALAIFSIIKSEKKFKPLGYLLLLQVILSIYNGLCWYEGLAFLKESFPILNQVNISRATFIQPLLWYIAIAYMFAIYSTYLKFFRLFLVIIITFQFYYALQVRRVSSHEQYRYITFNNYYAPKLFHKIKNDLNITATNISKQKFVSYGIEPAVALYNGLYTVDGYSTNYPITYKHIFRDVQDKECFETKFGRGNKKQYDTWGSKAYLLCVDSRPENYHYYIDRNITIVPFNASVPKLCTLGTKYILSGHHLKQLPQIKLIKEYTQKDETQWHIWIYKLLCH